MTNDNEDRLQASLLIKKLERREPKIARELMSLLQNILANQEEKLRGLEERNSYLEQINAEKLGERKFMSKAEERRYHRNANH